MEPVDEPRFGDGEIAALFAPLKAAPAIALAVSGGPDSLALLLLAARWRDLGGPRPEIHVLTVDHRLHRRSADDAAFVARLAAEREFAARILVRDGPAPATGIEAAAREARYRLLIGAAKDIGASHIVLAHHREDQAETFLMRLARGSGVHGLGAMRAISVRDGAILFRPFLDIPKARLAAVVRAAGIAPADDPANRDPRFLRTKLRALLPEMARAGIGPERIVEMARQMAAIAEAIDAQASVLLREAVSTDAFGIARMTVAPFQAAHTEVRHRALTRLLQAIGGAPYPPRGERLAALDRALTGGGDFRRTLAGTVIERAGATAFLYRETGRAGLPVIPVRGVFDGEWDGRFHLTVRDALQRPLQVGALGVAGLRQLAGARELGLPRAALAALPAVRRGDVLVRVPAFDSGGEAELEVRARSLIAARIFPHSVPEATVN